MSKTYDLRAVRIVKSRSRETACFSGALYFDGKKIAQLDNDGGGGPNLVLPVKGCEGEVAAFAQWCKAQPAHVANWGGSVSIPMSPDFWISLRVQDIEHDQEVHRLMSTRILYKNAGMLLQSRVLNAGERERYLASPPPAGCRVLTDAAEVRRLLFLAD